MLTPREHLQVALCRTVVTEGSICSNPAQTDAICADSGAWLEKCSALTRVRISVYKWAEIIVNARLLPAGRQRCRKWRHLQMGEDDLKAAFYDSAGISFAVHPGS